MFGPDLSGSNQPSLLMLELGLKLTLLFLVASLFPVAGCGKPSATDNQDVVRSAPQSPTKSPRKSAEKKSSKSKSPEIAASANNAEVVSDSKDAEPRKPKTAPNQTKPAKTNARTLLASTLKEAKASNRRVLIHLTDDW